MSTKTVKTTICDFCGKEIMINKKDSLIRDLRFRTYNLQTGSDECYEDICSKCTEEINKTIDNLRGN